LTPYKLFARYPVLKNRGQTMKLLQMLKTMMTARGLEILLLGKEVTAPNNVSLGIVTSIKKELSQDKIWMVIDNLGRESLIPIEEIARVAKKVTLFDDYSAYNLAELTEA
jgi:hypothetical protein